MFWYLGFYIWLLFNFLEHFRTFYGELMLSVSFKSQLIFAVFCLPSVLTFVLFSPTVIFPLRPSTSLNMTAVTTASRTCRWKETVRWFMSARARRLMGKRRSRRSHDGRWLKRVLAGCKGCILVHRVVAMMSPEDSWVAKWQRIGEEVKSLQTPGHVAAAFPMDLALNRLFTKPSVLSF